MNHNSSLTVSQCQSTWLAKKVADCRNHMQIQPTWHKYRFSIDAVWGWQLWSSMYILPVAIGRYWPTALWSNTTHLTNTRAPWGHYSCGGVGCALTSVLSTSASSTCIVSPWIRLSVGVSDSQHFKLNTILILKSIMTNNAWLDQAYS